MRREDRVCVRAYGDETESRSQGKIGKRSQLIRATAFLAASCVLIGCTPSLESQIRSELAAMGIGRKDRACIAREVVRRLQDYGAHSDFRNTLPWAAHPPITRVGQILERVRPHVTDEQYRIAEEAVRLCARDNR